jgi:hypothetical protein
MIQLDQDDCANEKDEAESLKVLRPYGDYCTITVLKDTQTRQASTTAFVAYRQHCFVIEPAYVLESKFAY